MHALLAVIDANNVGDKLSENVIGLEVTKDIKFFAQGRSKGTATNTDEFLEYTRELMAEKMKPYSQPPPYPWIYYTDHISCKRSAVIPRR